MQTKRAVSITVHGRVQGVGFRMFVRSHALKLGVNGIVKNQDDRSVYVEAEGNQNAISELIEKCKEGPMLASVNKIEVNEIKIKDWEGFTIEK